MREVLKARECSNDEVELQSLSREEGRDKEVGDVEVEWSPFKNMLVKEGLNYIIGKQETSRYTHIIPLVYSCFLFQDTFFLWPQDRTHNFIWNIQWRRRRATT